MYTAEPRSRRPGVGAARSCSACRIRTQLLSAVTRGHYSQAIAADPNNWLACIRRSNVYSGQSQYDQAIADYTQTIALQPANAEIYHLRTLGEEVEVDEERMMDMATAVSGTGPTYVFLVMEALVDAAVHLGFSCRVALQLVGQTVLGSALFATQSPVHLAELRNMVTSPGGTSAEAIYQLDKGGIRTVLSKAVWAAYQRSCQLGDALCRDGEEPGGPPTEGPTEGK